MRFLVARQVIGALVNAVGTIVLAKIIGPTAWGGYAVAFVLQVTAQGLLERNAAAYIIQRQKHGDARVVATMLSIQFVLGCVLGGLLLMSAPAIAGWLGLPDLVLLIAAAAVSTVAYSVRGVPLGALEARSAFGRVTLIELVDVVTFNVLAVVGAVAGLGYLSLAVAMAARAVVSAAAAFRLSGVRLRLGWAPSVARDALAFIAPFAATQLVGYANPLAAPALLGLFANVTQLGFFQLATSTLYYPHLLTGIAGRVAFPAMSRAQGDDARTNSAVSNSMSTAVRYFGGLSLVIGVASPLWVPLVYGPAWSDAVPYFLAAAAAYGLFPTFVFLTTAIQARGHLRATFGVGALYGIAYWCFGLALVPLFGGLGLIAAHAAAHVSFLRNIELYRRWVGRARTRGALGAYVAASLALIAVALAYVRDPADTAAMAIVGTAYAALLLWVAPGLSYAWAHYGRRRASAVDPRRP